MGKLQQVKDWLRPRGYRVSLDMLGPDLQKSAAYHWQTTTYEDQFIELPAAQGLVKRAFEWYGVERKLPEIVDLKHAPDNLFEEVQAADDPNAWGGAYNNSRNLLVFPSFDKIDKHVALHETAHAIHASVNRGLWYPRSAIKWKDLPGFLSLIPGAIFEAPLVVKWNNGHGPYWLAIFANLLREIAHEPVEFGQGISRFLEHAELSSCLPGSLRETAREAVNATSIQKEKTS